MAKNPYSMPGRGGNAISRKLMINPSPVRTDGGLPDPSRTGGTMTSTVNPMDAQRRMAEQARQDAMRRQQAAARGAATTANPTVNFRPSPLKPR